MKLFKTDTGIVIEKDGEYYAASIDNWDAFINDDAILDKLNTLINSNKASKIASLDKINLLQPPVGNQELWACGVTYLRSKVGRQEESQAAGGSDFYARVYEAERPEVFFKANAHRIRGNNEKVRIRKDSSWDVPEPELTLMVTSSGKIIGYTIGNDMSSRSIEGENPLYLPQAKTYDGCAAIGPCIFVTDQPLDINQAIELTIKRSGQCIFEGSVMLSQMKRTLHELVSFVYRECSFPYGALIMTGTGIVPGADFTLKPGDEIAIHFAPVGTLVNIVE